MTPLDYALLIIHSYEADIRSRADLVAEGFCQGSIYKSALGEIERLRDEAERQAGSTGEQA